MTNPRPFIYAILTTLGVGAGGALAASGAQAAGAPQPTDQRGAPAISNQDRVYTADQTSNTVSVIDPSSYRTLGTIALGDQRLGKSLSPQYSGDTGVHGLSLSPDQTRLAVVSVTSNTVNIVDTATNKVVSTTDVGRAPHEGSFTADGKQFWIANRGRDTVSIIDAVNGGVISTLRVGAGASKVVMSPDGRTAYINHTKMAQETVVDVASRNVVGHITGLAAKFASDQAISPDGSQIWVSHKQDGKISVLDLQQKKVVNVLETGPDTNHPQFVKTPDGSFVYLPVGGLNRTLVYRLDGTRATRVNSIRNHGHAPHGAWASADGTRMYVGLEKSDGVDVIDTGTQKVITTIGTGQEPQAVQYASGVAKSGDAPNLTKQGLDQRAHNVPTRLPDGSPGHRLDPVKGRKLEATIRPVGGLDMIQLQARGLEPNTSYDAYSVSADGHRRKVVSFPTDELGRAPMVLAFSSFEGDRIELRVKGQATPAQRAAYLSSLKSLGHAHGLTTADLLYCDCC